jgi:signal transduction histidine kinase
MTQARILIVEDEALLAEELALRVSRMGMTVVGTTGSGHEAVTLAGAQAPDLVLMDIRLRGGTDGITAASAIRERFGVPVVFITAYSDQATIERAKEAAPLGYLIKPFNERDLYVAIEMALHKRTIDRMTHKLLEAQRLESLGRLAGGVARNLGNVLEPILTNIRQAAEQAPHDSRLVRQLDTITVAAERAAELCRQMGEYAGGGTVAVTRAPFDQVVSEIEQLLRAAVGQRSSVTFEMGCADTPVDVDRAQIQQVAMQFALNAYEAIPENGAIVVATCRVTLRQEDVDGLEGGDYAILEVRDNGAGMDEATRARVFEPFFTTKAVGRGLGLATAQGVARAHHGTITASSAPGGGAVFRLYLPVAA